MRIKKASYLGNPNIGFFCFATNDICFAGMNLSKGVEKSIKEILGVEVVRTTMLGMDLISFFIAGNSNGVIIHKNIERKEIKKIKDYTDVMLLDTKYNALGNLILANDKGCIISGKIRKYGEQIKEFLHVKKIEVTTINKIALPGSLASCNNHGCLTHNKINENEKKLIEQALDVQVIPSTLNNKNPWIRSTIVINDRGAIVGENTTPIEMANVYKLLGD